MKLGCSLYWYCVKTDTLNYVRRDSCYTDARTALKQALASDSLNPVVWYILANVNKELGRMQEADTCYSQTIMHSIPGFIGDAYIGKAECSEAAGNYSEMADAYEKAYFYKPSNRDILLKLSALCEIKMKDPDKAAKYYRQYLETLENPDDRMTLIIKKKLETLNKKNMNR